MVEPPSHLSVVVVSACCAFDPNRNIGRDQCTLLCETGHNDPEVLILRLQLAGSLCHYSCPEFTRVHCDWPALIHPGVTVGDALVEHSA
jgi:hypothetical protein